MMGINNLDREMMVLVVLEASDDYLFVETGPDGEVEHYRPSLVSGEKQHMVAVSSTIYYCFVLVFRQSSLIR